MKEVAFSPDGKHIINGNEDGTLRLRDVATGQPIGLPWQGNQEPVQSIAFSPDGKRVISGYGDSTLILWDVASGQLIGPPLQWYRFDDFDFFINDIDSGQKFRFGKEAIMRQTCGTVSGVAFSSDGKHVISWISYCGGLPNRSPFPDSDLILWQVDPHEWVKIACRKVNRNFTKAEWTRFIGDVLPYQKTCEDLPLEGE